MANKLINPEYKPHLELGISDKDWDIYKVEVTDYLQANGGSATLNEDDIRALNPDFSDDRLWAQLIGDLGLFSLGVLVLP